LPFNLEEHHQNEASGSSITFEEFTPGMPLRVSSKILEATKPCCFKLLMGFEANCKEFYLPPKVTTFVRENK